MAERKKTKWTLKGTLGLIAFTLFIVYMVIPCFLWSPVYQMLVVAPSRADEKQYALAIANSKHKPEDVYFHNENGDKLHGWYYKHPASKNLVLIHHGNAGNISTRWQLPDFINDCGANVLLYDYRGYGRSTGKPTTSALIEDGHAAAKFSVEKLGYKPEQIIHYGESIGSGIACDVAAKNKCGGVIFHSGLASLPSVGKVHFQFLLPYPDFLFPPPQMRNVDLIRQVHAPVLIFAAIPDGVVPYHQGEAVFANANEPKQLVLFQHSQHNCTVGDDCIKFDHAMRDYLTKL